MIAAYCITPLENWKSRILMFGPYSFLIHNLDLFLVLIMRQKILEIIKRKLEKCIKNDPSNPDYLFEMGVYHFGVGNDTLASEYFEASIALDDTQPLPYYLLADINFWLGEYEIAYEQISNAVELNSNNPRYHELKGQVSELLGDPKYVLNYKHMYETCNHPDVCFRAAYEINGYLNSIDAIDDDNQRMTSIT